MTAFRAVSVPGPSQMREALDGTFMLLRLRWRMVRGWRRRALVYFGLGLLFLVLFFASEIGDIVRNLAEQGDGTAANVYASNYIIALHRGDLGYVGAAALGSALAASLFSPFTGASNLALASADDLTLLRPNKLHRYFDSIITHSISTIGFLQIVALTGVGSLLTLDGGRAGGLLITWAVWPTLVLASVAEGWAIEWLYRSIGGKIRRTIGLGLAAVVLAALWLNPSHGKTLFGLGNVYSTALRQAQAGNTGFVVSVLAVLAGACAVLYLLGMALCQAALSHPAPPLARAKGYRAAKYPTTPNAAIARLILTQMWRTAEVRRPLVTILMLGIPAAWFSKSTSSTLTTMVIAIPLAVALSWGVNFFGVLGPGMTWLANQPNFMRRVMWISALVQLATVVVISVLCFAPPALLGVVDPTATAALAAGLVASTMLTTRSASHKAINRPFLAKLGTRGDVIIPPLTAINYTLRFAAFGGQIGVLIMTRSQVFLQMALVIAVALWSFGRFAYLVRRWNNRETQSRVIAAVAPA